MNITPNLSNKVRIVFYSSCNLAGTPDERKSNSDKNEFPARLAALPLFAPFSQKIVLIFKIRSGREGVKKNREKVS